MREKKVRKYIQKENRHEKKKLQIEVIKTTNLKVYRRKKKSMGK